MIDVLFYSSSHGFGHASRDYQVIRALNALDQRVRAHVRSAVADWFSANALDGVPCDRSSARLDLGIVQSDSLQQDLKKTLEACRANLSERPRLIEQEVALMHALQPKLIVADMPGIPFVAARRVGIPALAFGNFSWDWIYDAFVDAHPGFAEIRDSFSADYALADGLLRLPFHGGAVSSAAFRAVEDMPLVARESTVSRGETRHRLGLPSDVPVVLLSFGGLGAGAIDAAALEVPELRRFQFVVTPPVSSATPHSSRFRTIENARLTMCGLSYPDLVHASDVVLTKPGYGIVSECLINETRVLYTSRGEFREYPNLVEALERDGAAAFIPPEDFRAGHWAPYLETLLARPTRACPFPRDGAASVARILLDRIRKT